MVVPVPSALKSMGLEGAAATVGCCGGGVSVGVAVSSGTVEETETGGGVVSVAIVVDVGVGAPI